MSHGAEGTFMTFESKLLEEFFKLEDLTTPSLSVMAWWGNHKIFIINTCRGLVENPGIFFHQILTKELCLNKYYLLYKW
jgi:hypothetical protein